MPLSNDVSWKYPFHALSGEEIADPMLVIDELFDFAHLPHVRELLWEWLKTTVTGSYHRTLESDDQYALVMLYEKIDKLVEAAAVLHEKNKKLSGRKKAKRKADKKH